MSSLAHYPGVVMPTVEEEIWRYSRIEELNLDTYVAGSVVNHVDAPSDVASIVTQGAAVGECGVAMPIPVDAFAEINAIHCSGRVVEKLVQGGERCVRIELLSANQFGQAKIVGEALVALP
jgi:hypothetical protein